MKKTNTPTTEQPKSYSREEMMHHVDKAWDFIGEALDNISHSKHGRKLFALNQGEELDYRRNETRRFAITVGFTARLLSVQWLLGYVCPQPGHDHRMTLKDVIHCKPSCVYAASLAANYRKQIKAALKESGADIGAIRAAEYHKLVKP